MKLVHIKPGKQLSLALSFIFLNLTLIAQDWSSVPGIVAQDISVGKGGVVWATGTKGNIYRWNGTSWETIAGGASRVAVDPDGTAWVVNSAGQIYKYNSISGSWDTKPGGATDIGVGADGSVWCIGMGATGGGNLIYKWNGSDWTNIPGGAVRIAVNPSGNAWVVNNTGNVLLYNGHGWDSKPGSVKDIGIGADGSVWCIGTDLNVYRWDGSNWAMRSGGGQNISVTPDGHPWVANAAGAVFRMGPAATIITRTIFPRKQDWEYKILRALRYGTYPNQVIMGGKGLNYSQLDTLAQGFGGFALQAAELLYAGNASITADQIVGQIQSNNSLQSKLNGILCVLVMNTIAARTDDPYVSNWSRRALRLWTESLFRSIKIRCASAVLGEYQKWKNDPCRYQADGYKAPPDCALKGLNFTQWYGQHSPPSDIIGKAGLKSVLGNNADAVASGTAISAATVALIAAGVGLGASALGSTISATGAITTVVSLYSAFGGTSGALAGTGAAAAAGAIGAGGWASVVAAPVAAAVLCIVVGTIEGIRVVENAKVEPTLKMKLGAAMTEYINIYNVLADSSSTQLLYIAFQEAAQNGFQITQPKVNGEVRFFCQAGYVSSFRLSYNVNGQAQTFTTPDLSAGFEKSFPLPYNATNIQVQGWYQLGTWKDLFNVSLAQPTYICYTSYGTVIDPKFKNDCPEVGNMVSAKNNLTVTQGGGYVAWVRLEYTDGGQNKRVLDKSDCGGGWRQVFEIPATATNIHLQVWSATGLTWDPWKTIVDKSWPSPPNECIKVYNTTLDPKWDNECN
jgi:hypothetical protein